MQHTSMFRTLRRRLTLLYAGTTLILLSVVAIGMMWWLNQQFLHAADEMLYMRMTHELEERKVAAMLCVAIDIENPKNEQSWVISQLSRSQFPDLADDEEMMEEMEQILKELRATQGQ